MLTTQVVRTRVLIPRTHKNVEGIWLPSSNSSAGKAETGTTQARKMASQISYNSKLWLQLRDLTTVNKVENNRGRPLISALGPHTHTYTQTHMHTCAYTHTYTKIKREREREI